MPHSINDSCNGCSACFRQCATGAIVGEFKKRYRVIESLCIDCAVCGFICPVAAVVDPEGHIAKRVPRNQRPRPLVDPDLCNGCGRCADSCPFDCRQVVGRPYLGVSYLATPDACTGCGECVKACLKGAVTLGQLDLTRFDPIAERERLLAMLAAPP